jgi:hypothetical protein
MIMKCILGESTFLLKEIQIQMELINLKTKIIMRTILYLNFIFCLCNTLPINAQQESISHIEYSVKENGRLFYTYIKPRDAGSNETYIRSVNLLKKEIYPRVRFISDPKGWKVKDDIIFRIKISQRKNSIGSAEIKHYILETKDSLEVLLEKRQLGLEFKSKYGHLKGKERIKKALEFEGIKSKEKYNPAYKNFYGSKNIPIYKALSWQIMEEKYKRESDNTASKINLDLLINDKESLCFFIRYNNIFTIWEYKYPTINDDKYHQGRWKEILTYSSTTSIPFLSTNAKDYYPSGKEEQTKYEAIKDDAFFDGEFKVIKQGKNRFVINTVHGAIYHIGSSQIVKVGQVELKEYKRRIGGKSLFIEDKDEEEVIFFAPVKIISNKANAPYLKTKVILEDSEFNRIFKNL